MLGVILEYIYFAIILSFILQKIIQGGGWQSKVKIFPKYPDFPQFFIRQQILTQYFVISLVCTDNL